MNLRYPNITAGSEREQLKQVQSWLHQLVDELNMTAGFSGTGGAGRVVYRGTGGGESSPEKDALATFNSIKSLIIKSADIVNAWYDRVTMRLEGVYVAESEFGSFAEKTSQDIEANSTEIKSLFSNLQTIVTDIEGLEHAVIEVNAHIKTGLLYYGEDGAPVYGLEIGQRNELDGVETFNKYARFTADKLSFYDQNDNEVAYISDRKLYITHVEVKGSFLMGGFTDTVEPDGGIVTQWVGIGV
jgi:hypothetical protein